MIERIQRKRTKGFRLPPNTVCVDRSTKLGNPFGAVANPDRLKNPDAKGEKLLA